MRDPIWQPATEVLLYCSCRGSLICRDAPFLPLENTQSTTLQTSLSPGAIITSWTTSTNDNIKWETGQLGMLPAAVVGDPLGQKLFLGAIGQSFDVRCESLCEGLWRDCEIMLDSIPKHAQRKSSALVALRWKEMILLTADTSYLRSCKCWWHLKDSKTIRPWHARNTDWVQQRPLQAGTAHGLMICSI